MTSFPGVIHSQLTDWLFVFGRCVTRRPCSSSTWAFRIWCSAVSTCHWPRRFSTTGRGFTARRSALSSRWCVTDWLRFPFSLSWPSRSIVTSWLDTHDFIPSKISYSNCWYVKNIHRWKWSVVWYKKIYAPRTCAGDQNSSGTGTLHRSYIFKIVKRLERSGVFVPPDFAVENKWWWKKRVSFTLYIYFQWRWRCVKNLFV